jgi:hypothetical protein
MQMTIMYCLEVTPAGYREGEAALNCAVATAGAGSYQILTVLWAVWRRSLSD